MLGAYRLADDTLEFAPTFPLRRSLRYVAVFDASALSRILGADSGSPHDVRYELVVPTAEPGPATALVAIFPSAEILPSNLLRLYLHFSSPMRQGDSYRHIRLLDAASHIVDDAFVELDHELWNPQGNRLTLLFDPGRLKSGLRPRREVGAPLREGHDFILEIDGRWLDAAGRPLASGAAKEFSVAPADHESPSTSLWVLTAPRAATTSPLGVRFDEPLDEALLHHMLEVVDGNGARVPGEVEIGQGETSWRFIPDAPWLPGDYLLRVHPRLEDQAGNSLAKLFEVDLTDGDASVPSEEPIELGFAVVSPAGEP